MRWHRRPTTTQQMEIQVGYFAKCERVSALARFRFASSRYRAFALSKRTAQELLSCKHGAAFGCPFGHCSLLTGISYHNLRMGTNLSYSKKRSSIFKR